MFVGNRRLVAYALPATSGAGWLVCVAGFVMLTGTAGELRNVLLEPTLRALALAGLLLLPGLLMTANWFLHRHVEVRS